MNRRYSKTMCAAPSSINMSNFKLLEESFSCRAGNITERSVLFELNRIVDNEQSYGVSKNQAWSKWLCNIFSLVHRNKLSCGRRHR
ncbi:hypothetical protein Y032_0629g848 [Ancylostoma ceylanicum]|uniref:Uncharacterized protein n=1 Tax=Ancylostoma ceylanicum TaxID=53326 RepID=A0A016WKJ8_9BILA|nr:hypothetical protein Y032_0629g848 [Ancylostoma ceylanicum]